MGSTGFGTPLLVGKWQLYREDGSVSWFRVHTRHAAQPRYALLDAELAYSFHLPDIEALPVVLDDER